MGGVSEDVLLARAFLSRVGEPGDVPLWRAVREDGPVATMAALRAGTLRGPDFAATAARAAEADPSADLDAAQRHGMRLVVPEADEWPHFAFAALEATGLRRAAAWARGARHRSESGEPVPPLALWIRGVLDLAPVGVRSVAVVGARAASDYGECVARDFAARLAERGFVVVSGGAYGIDAAAHRGALSVEGQTVLVSAGGLDRPYPPGNAALYDRIAETGLLVSESPPGADPRRHRFLSRNRIIAALGTGTVVVEASERSGALNTATHCTRLGRVLMAVPGPISARQSAGCHRLIRSDTDPARLVTSVADVIEAIGSAGELAPAAAPRTDALAGAAERTQRLDGLEPTARRVFDAFPARGWVGPDRLAVASGVEPLAVIRALPMLELAGLVESSPAGYRIARTPGEGERPP
jgi:DNA processing protein